MGMLLEALDETATYIAATPLRLVGAHLAGMAFYLGARIASEVVCRYYIRMKPGVNRDNVVGSLSAYLHAIPACAISYIALQEVGWSSFDSSEWASADFAAENTPIQLLAMTVTTSFMLYDHLQMLLTKSKETLYMWHHFGVYTATISCMLMGRGGLGMIIGLFWGEITNPIQNAWIVTCSLHDDGMKHVRGLRTLLAWSVVIELSVLRFLYVPVAYLWVMWDNLVFTEVGGATLLPLPLRIFWCLIPTAVVIGTALHIQGMMNDKEMMGLAGDRQEKSKKK